MKCLACGSEALVPGSLMDNSGGGTTGFIMDETPIWKSVLGIGYRSIRAYGCVHCGNLQLAVDFSDTDRRRYQQFEGEQPDVLQRLASGSENTQM